MSSDQIIVIGAGIIGTSIASSLSRRGVPVLVVDAGEPLYGTSSANAGHFVPSHVLAFAAPGMVEAGFQSWRKRDGAFALNPSLRGEGAQWLARFVASCTDENVTKAAPALRGLFDHTRQQLERLLVTGASFDFQSGGLIQVFTEQSSLDGARHEIDVMRGLGVEVDELSSDQLLAAEPTLRGVAGGFRLVNDGRLDPALLLSGLKTEAIAHGAQYVSASVREIRPTSTGVNVVTTAGTMSGAQVVVAGYSVTVTGVANEPRLPLLLVDQRLAVTAMSRGLRITGRYELTNSSDRSIPPTRVAALVELARPVLGLAADVVTAEPWSGLRPASPDGLPVIGRLASDDRVLVCAGHGMLGTASGPGTGEAVASVICGESLAFDVAALSPERFGSIDVRGLGRGFRR